MASIRSSNTNGANVSYTYDDLQRLSTVVDNRLSGNNTTSYTYDPASNLTTATYPNGVQSTMTYDALNRISGLATQNSGYVYQRGPTGNLTSTTELNGRTVNWSFDGIYRLTNETIASDPGQANGSVSYSLDPVGNRLSDTSSLAGINSGSFGYNADDEVSTETYDSNGNATQVGAKSFTYDAENHLTGMNVSGTVVNIVYDAFGNRVAKNVNGVTTQYLVEDDVNPTGYPQVLDELTGSTVTRTYTYGLQRINEDQIVNGAWTPSFYSYDGGGNVRQLTNLTGAVTDTYEYDAFGNNINHTGTTPNNYHYRGEQYDSDLGLYYLRARYYNPSASRFLSRDPEDGIPTDPKTLHKYVYAGGDPVNAMDPTGRAVALGYAQFTFWDAVKTTAKAVALSGAIDCVYEFITTKFDGTIQVAFDGGSITQVGPCVWLFANAQKALPQPVAPAQPIVGTRASPWPPQCDQLKQVVDNAKALAAGLGRCTPGMSPWQLQARYDAWIALGAARAQYNMVCWNGGDSGHQQADANAWLAAGQCAALKAAF